MGSDNGNRKNNAWMPFFVGDYLSDTMHLTTEQHGAYLLLIMAYWKTQRPLPADDTRLAAISKFTPDAWSMNKAVLQEYFDLEAIPGLWVHHRVDKEILKSIDRAEKARERGKKGAAARWDEEPFDA